MSGADWIVACCLALAVVIALFSAFCQMLMTRPLDRLQYTAPVTTLAAALVVIAVWIKDPDFQSRIKVLFTAGILFVMNGVLTHATARAMRTKQLGHWELRPEDQIEIVKE